MSELPRGARDVCRSCPADVVWCETLNGRSMLVNRHASERGTIEIQVREGRPPLARVVMKADRAGRTDLHLSHFATCRAATEWRGKRGRR